MLLQHDEQMSDGCCMSCFFYELLPIIHVHVDGDTVASMFVTRDREKKRKKQRLLRIRRVLDRKITSVGTVDSFGHEGRYRCGIEQE